MQKYPLLNTSSKYNIIIKASSLNSSSNFYQNLNKTFTKLKIIKIIIIIILISILQPIIIIWATVIYMYNNNNNNLTTGIKVIFKLWW